MGKTSLFLAALALFMFVSAGAAQADLILILSSDGDIKRVVDDAAAGVLTAGGTLSNVGDSIGTAGVIGYNGSVGKFSVNVTTGISKPVIGPRKIDLNSVNVTGDAGELFIFLLDTDFMHPVGGPRMLISTIGGVSGGTLRTTAGWNSGNGEGGFANITTFGPFGLGPFSGTEMGVVNITPGSAFAMGEAVWITHTAAGQISSFDFETTIPEPATACLLLVGLAGFAARRRRKSA